MTEKGSEAKPLEFKDFDILISFNQEFEVFMLEDSDGLVVFGGNACEVWENYLTAYENENDL